MAHNSTTGRTPGLSMAEFNARAKKIAAATGEVEKGAARRAPPSRFRRDGNPNAAKPAESESESEPAESSESAESESESEPAESSESAESESESEPAESSESAES